jgi:hypothetical protein
MPSSTSQTLPRPEEMSEVSYNASTVAHSVTSSGLLIERINEGSCIP